MPQGIISLNGDVLENISQTVFRCLEELQVAYDDAQSKIASVSGDWEDENYKALVNSLEKIHQQIVEFQDVTNKTLQKINTSSEFLKIAHGIKL